jgi:septal ring factor EnvC (AmiA/AmiB activator)
VQKEINLLEKEINSIQDNYARYVVAIYKSGKNSEWADVFNSGSVQEALLRYKYLNEFSERRSKNLSELHEKKEKLNAERNSLKKEIREKASLTKQKQDEKNLLDAKLEERKKILKSIRKDKKVLADELKLKKSSEGRIKEMISRLVEQADLNRKKKADLAAVEEGNSEAGNKNLFSESFLNSPDLSFSSLKGKLTWPVSKGKIVNNFGENRNKVLNTVTINYGIDIKPDDDINVKAVADGVVSAVEWIPGYGSVIIISHNEEYRTVYGHLSEIFVEENETVSRGAVIANIAEDIEGRLLHFEIWNSRINQDPEIWLAGK